MICFSDGSRRSLILESAPLQYKMILPDFRTTTFEMKTNVIDHFSQIDDRSNTDRHSFSIIVKIQNIQ